MHAAMGKLKQVRNPFSDLQSIHGARRIQDVATTEYVFKGMCLFALSMDSLSGGTDWQEELISLADRAEWQQSFADGIRFTQEHVKRFRFEANYISQFVRMINSYKDLQEYNRHSKNFFDYLKKNRITETQQKIVAHESMLETTIFQMERGVNRVISTPTGDLYDLEKYLEVGEKMKVLQLFTNNIVRPGLPYKKYDKGIPFCLGSYSVLNELCSHLAEEAYPMNPEKGMRAWRAIIFLKGVAQSELAHQVRDEIVYQLIKGDAEAADKRIQFLITMKDEARSIFATGTLYEFGVGDEDTLQQARNLYKAERSNLGFHLLTEDDLREYKLGTSIYIDGIEYNFQLFAQQRSPRLKRERLYLVVKDRNDRSYRFFTDAHLFEKI